MKVSEILQQALDNHYCNGTENYRNKGEFMCHAVHFLFAEQGYNSCNRHLASGFTETKKTIEEAICGQFTLHSHLLGTNKRYRQYKRRYHPNTPACYKIRRQFWTDLIAKLVAEGK